MFKQIRSENSSLSLVRRVALVAGLVAVCGTAAFGQSTAVMPTESGSSVSVKVDLTIATSYGTFSGTDTDTAAATGSAQLTVFPADPVFTDALGQAFVTEVGDLEFSYSFFFGIVTIDVDVNDLRIEAVEPFLGTIGSGGATYCPAATMHVTGSATVVSSLGVNQTEAIDQVSTEPLNVRITESSGVLTLDQIDLPVVETEADPAELPDGVSGVTVVVTVTTSNLSYAGPYYDALLGDWDGDGDVDAADYVDFEDCLLGPDVEIGTLCTLFDFDGDDDVDLLDFAEFQVGE